MKPIIIDMKEISDSTEVYESKPNRILVYTIYIILTMVVVAVLWMALFKMDIVVKSNGIFKGSNAIYEISSGVTGSVKRTHIKNGQYVKEGDILYVLSIDELSDTILRYQNELEAAQARLEILSGYEKSLDGDQSGLETLTDNPYYKEFLNRKELLFANINLGKSDTTGQVTLHQGNVDSLSGTISKYNEKIEKLNNVKQCIMVRNNTFDSSEGIYYSMVSSYLASYSYTTLQYDNQINEYQRQIDEYEEQIKKAEIPATGDETVGGNDLDVEADSTATQSSNVAIDVEALKKQRDALIVALDSAQKERTQALMNLELQQIATIEQQISGYNDTILSLETNLTSAKLQLDAVNGVDTESKEMIAILTEKGNIAAEILTYKDKVKECETYLKSYDIQNDNCIIKANVSGYFYVSQDLKTGSFVQEGSSIGTIYPEAESKYYAEIYVENTDIGKIKEEQKVKFEIAAYPSSEYGYFEGTVENIAKDISVDQSTGYAYYVVRVKCENMTLKGKDGKEVTLINGMACQAKIVTDEKKILTYLLEKINLLA
ncbi:HlyD family efflux transporter periplasmic adaptor subunit [Mediterraneibacter gnavus]|uniref:HlyD family efflux transporter periplasmic adaptor subunit n=1 Tax=Mediterraneibacter gnavus TaxID=33038 RepID=UPI000467DA79|nr:HlyD family efflux transporter periplasmic adaptor subunit [Mediterraneibacter gnavus]